jgi:DNA-binding transcriptional ArsR family regulator
MHALDALGNPVRREILIQLRAQPATVGEIAARFPVSRPAISRHLATLQRAGLVVARATGARTLYAVRLEGFASVRTYLDGFWDSALARLEQLARAPARPAKRVRKSKREPLR